MRYGIMVFFTCFYTLSAFALFETKRTYHVEVLLFSHITTQTLQMERWPQLSGDEIKTFDDIISPAKNITVSVLTTEKKSMERDPHYKILAHAAWQATWVGEDATLSFPVHVAKSANRNETVDGLITIRLNHYFNTHVDLFLTVPSTTLKKLSKSGYFNVLSKPTFTFQLLRDQRMRSNELNYISNSLLGMLIKITPTTKP